MLGSKLDDQIAISERRIVRRDDKAAVGLGRESDEVLLDIIRVTNGYGSQSYCLRLGCGVCSIGHSRLSQAAKALRLTIPDSILARFDEVIE
jgi:hypothetical protein